MRLTSFSDYSLRVLMYLAADPGRRATIAEIATVFGVSEHHLVKVAHFLGKCGWLLTVRGKGGGVELGMPADAICVGEVVRQAEGDPVMAECFGDGEVDCAIAGACRLRGVFVEAVDALYAVLDRYSLADIVGSPQLARVLRFESPAAGAAIRQERHGIS